jgi:hypothetical protein
MHALPATPCLAMPDHDPQDSGFTQPLYPVYDGSLHGAGRGGESRQAEADAIAWELSLREDLDAVPDVVQEFLFRSWTRVLAHVRLSSASSEPEPHLYEKAIDDLVWSVKPDATLRQPTELLRRVPPLLATLRQGLSLIGEEAAHDHFFIALMKLHGPVLKLRRARSRRDAAVGESTWSGVSQAAALLPPAGDAVSGPPERGDASGFEPTMLFRHDDVLSPEYNAAQADAATTGVDGLREGDWVELRTEDRRVRAQLQWVSGNARFFLFVSDGSRQHSMTRRVCERLLRDGLLVPLASAA